MKTTMNLTNDPCDLQRFTDAADLRSFYQSFGLHGLELMPLHDTPCDMITPDMVVGVHLCCPPDWVNMDFDVLCAAYRHNLEFARRMDAEYVVFHASQVSMEEAVTYHFAHTDEEVVSACCRLINLLTDGQDYAFYFLLENQWYPGLTFLKPSVAEQLLEGIHYSRTGFMLDTGHLMNTCLSLRTPDDAVSYIHQVLDGCTTILPHIRGIHLNQSLSGAYVQEFLQKPPVTFTDETVWANYVYGHIFQTDQHRPFVADGVQKLVDRIAPEYITYEYITENREQMAEFFQAGVLQPCQTRFP